MSIYKITKTATIELHIAAKNKEEAKKLFEAIEVSNVTIPTTVNLSVEDINYDPDTEAWY